jgi:hypothetical protein
VSKRTGVVAGVNMSSDAAVAALLSSTAMDVLNLLSYVLVVTQLLLHQRNHPQNLGISIEKLVKKAGTQDEFKNDISCISKSKSRVCCWCKEHWQHRT